MRKIIFHYHLFKNAGSSVDAILKSNFPTQWVTREFNSTYDFNQQQVALWCEQESQVVAFSSHTALLPPPKIADTTVFPILFIRHPIDRIASAYEFEKHQDGDSPAILLARNNSLAGYIEHHLSHERISQCRNFQSHRLAQFSNANNSADMLEAALHAIGQLPFIGLVDAFEESLQRLTHWLLPHFPDFEAVAVAKNVRRGDMDLPARLAAIQKEIGDECYQQLLDANSDDMAVYEQIKNTYGKKQIPKTIMQFWHSADLPADIAPLVANWQQQHPNFNHQLFNDDTARSYLSEHFPVAYLEAFNECAIPAMRCDFFRYAFIFNEGGIYVDAGIDCLKPLPDWLDFSQQLIMLKKPKGGGRITNSFIAAKAHSGFIQAVLTQSLSNIQNQISNNVWLVTGPGVINTLFKNSVVKPQMQIIELAAFKQHCHIFNDLEHKKTIHWSLVQNEQSIFTTTIETTQQIALSNQADSTTANIRLVLIGHPRCGSKSLAKYLSQAGLATGHERLAFNDEGLCSWWLTANRKPALGAYLYKSKTDNRQLKPELVCHFIRNPLDAIPSIIIENEHNQRNNNSFKARQQTIKRKFSVDLAEYDALTAATLSYVYWNKLAEQAVPDLRVRVEHMETDLQPIMQYYGLTAEKNIPKLNTSATKFGVADKLTVDVDILMAAAVGKAGMYLRNYLNLYYP